MKRSVGIRRASDGSRSSRKRGATAMLVTLAVLGAVVTVACVGAPSSGQFNTVLDLAGEHPLPVALNDETGHVTAVESAPSDDLGAPQLVVRADRTSSSAFIVSWLGGACDNDAALTFKRTEAGYLVNVAIHGKVGLGCTALGVPRNVRIITASPIPIAAIVAAGHT